MHFASFLSGEFTTMAVINLPEKKPAKHTSVQWPNPWHAAATADAAATFYFAKRKARQLCCQSYPKSLTLLPHMAAQELIKFRFYVPNGSQNIIG